MAGGSADLAAHSSLKRLPRRYGTALAFARFMIAKTLLPQGVVNPSRLSKNRSNFMIMKGF